MQTRSQPGRRFTPPALALLFCLGASQAPAATTPAPAPSTAPAPGTALETAEKPKHKVIRAKVAPPRIATKPQRPVKQLGPK